MFRMLLFVLMSASVSNFTVINIVFRGNNYGKSQKVEVVPHNQVFSFCQRD